MSIIDSIISTASEEIGVTEYPPRSNNVKYNTDYYGREVSGSEYPWCMVFVWWVFKHAGYSKYFYDGNKIASCTAMMNWAKSKHYFINSGYRAGDILLFNFDGAKHESTHTGICTGAEGNVVYSIEGNTGNGSDTNGGAVMPRTRPLQHVVGACRPPYSDTSYHQQYIPTYDGTYEIVSSTTEVPTSKDLLQFVDTVIGPVYTETVSNHSSQPMMSFVELFIGDQKLTLLPPRYVMSFEFLRSLDDAGGTFTLKLFDDNWVELEYLLSHNQDTLKFRYGYVTGKQSKLYSAVMTQYDLEFRSTGTILTVEGYTSGTVIGNLVNMTLDTDSLSPTEAAKQIARAAGWQVSDENFHPSHVVEFPNRDSITIVNDRPATYIINKLAPLAIRVGDNKGGYRFFLDETTSPPTAHFRPLDMEEMTKRTYVYMKGVDSPIQDLKLRVNGVLGGSVSGQLVTTGYETTFIDTETKEEFTNTETIDSVRVDVSGEYSHTKSNQYISTIDAAGSSASQMRAILRYRVSTSYVIPYEGYMTILGDPGIEIYQTTDDTIRLMIITDDGNLHHSSGLYLITGVTDTIEDGIMMTTLQLHKYEDIQEGIELVNYKSLKK